MMIDCGSDSASSDFSYYTIDSYLEEINVTNLKYIFCTHPDEDHFEGFPAILENRKYGTVFCSKTEKESQSFISFKKDVESFIKKIKVPKEGNRYTLGSAFIEILCVNQGKSDNDSSIVMMITFGNTKFLFTGDAENLTENYLIQKKDISCTVLKAAHHGSETSSRNSFLQKAEPEYIVVSTDENSRIAEDLLTYIDNHDTKAFYTYQTGTIICISDGRTVEFKTRDGNILN